MATMTASERRGCRHKASSSRLFRFRIALALLLLLLSGTSTSNVSAWSLQSSSGTVSRSPTACRSATTISSHDTSPNQHDDAATSTSDTTPTAFQPRRGFLAVAALSLGMLPAVSSAADAAGATRAIGIGEAKCREAGNCLEVGEWDGAVGWNWGGKDRCDALADPYCGPDGKVRYSITAKPVPQPQSHRITHALALQLDIGRTGETGLLKLGLYGDDCPDSVQQVLDFCSGMKTQQQEFSTLEEYSVPVSLAVGGIVSGIVPGISIDLGVPSQAYAYARSKGLSKAGNGFVPQPRPAPLPAEQQDIMVRPHDAAGLLSVPRKGLGYANNNKDDEAFASAFLITCDAAPALDKAGRRVIGQVLDATSMAFLERLGSLPTKKGITGVIPGQTSGPPLVKVTVRQVQVAKVEG